MRLTPPHTTSGLGISMEPDLDLHSTKTTPYSVLHDPWTGASWILWQARKFVHCALCEKLCQHAWPSSVVSSSRSTAPRESETYSHTGLRNPEGLQHYLYFMDCLYSVLRTAYIFVLYCVGY